MRGRPEIASYLNRYLPSRKRTETEFTIPATLMNHAVDTFGCERVARLWRIARCKCADLSGAGASAEAGRWHDLGQEVILAETTRPFEDLPDKSWVHE